MGYSDNLSAVLDSYDREFPSRRVHLLEVINRADYARYLHDRRGFFVMNDRLALNAVERALKELVASGRPITDDAIEAALEEASDNYVALLQSLTSEMRPPIRAGGPERPAHPGHWADRTTELASSFERVINGQNRKEYDYEGTAYAEE